MNFKYFVIVSYVNGSMNGKWQSNILRNFRIVKKENLKENIINHNKYKTFVGFNDYDTAEIFLSLLESNCFRFGLLKTKDDQKIKGKCFQYIPNCDFKIYNTEEKIYKFFNITEDEKKIIEDTMKKYS